MTTALRYHWSRLKPASLPAPHFGSSMVYDPRNQHIVLVAGSATWLWDGSTWSQASAPFPVRNSTHLAYDAGAQRVFLFGGIGLDGTPLNDTWFWDGSIWQEQHPATTPPPMGGAAITYDAARQHMIVFGGITGFDGIEGSNRVGTLLNETWLWDGTTWLEQQVDTTPPARLGGQLVYDEARQQTLLFGGSNADGYLNDLWQWNGTAWTMIAATTPLTPRARPHLLFHRQARQVVVMGGMSQAGRLHDVWLWDGTAWSEAAAIGAPPGSIESAAYDAARDVVLAFVVTGSKPVPGNKHHPKPVDLSPPALASETWTWG